MTTTLTDRPSRSLEPPPPIRPSPRARRAWQVAGGIAAVVMVVWGTSQVLGLLAHEERTEVRTIAGADVAALSIDSDGGTVEVIGADVDDIEVTARISDGLLDTGYDVEVVDDRLEIAVRCNPVLNQWCRVGLRVVVPRDLMVEVRTEDGRISLSGVAGTVDATSDDGSIEVDGVDGPLHLATTNGSVRATNVGATLIEARTTNGSVRVEAAVPPESLVARSTNGSVEVIVPRGDETYAVDIDASNGSEDNLVGSDPASSRQIVAVTTNGSATVRYRT